MQGSGAFVRMLSDFRLGCPSRRACFIIYLAKIQFHYRKISINGINTRQRMTDAHLTAAIKVRKHDESERRIEISATRTAPPNPTSAITNRDIFFSSFLSIIHPSRWAARLPRCTAIVCGIIEMLRGKFRLNTLVS